MPDPVDDVAPGAPPKPVVASDESSGRMRRLASSRTARQAAAFTGASALASILSLVATAIVARNLSTDAFGTFSFSVALLGYAAMFFELGVYAASARIAATHPAERRDVVGGALLLFVPLAVAFTVVVVVLSPLVSDWFGIELGWPFVVAALLGAGYPFAFNGQLLAQGVDRLHVASAGGAIFPLTFVGLLAVLVGTASLDGASALVSRSIALLVAGAVVAIWLRPRFQGVGAAVRRILRETRAYGFQVYVGRLLSIGTYNMDVLLVGLWSTADQVGYYALATAIAGAAGLPVIAVSTALFARLATEPRIDSRWLWQSAAFGTALAFAAWLVAGPFVDIVFSDRYQAVVGLLVPLLIAQVIRGTTSLFNTFLSAHGHGRELRDAGIILTVGNLALNFALIPPYGAMGAAWASVGALVANLVAHVVFYRRALRSAS